MFSDNNIISGRQFGRMIFVETSGTGALLALSIVSRYGGSGLFLLAAVFATAFLLVMAAFAISRSITRHENALLACVLKKYVLGFFGIIFIIKFLIMNAAILVGLSRITKLILIEDVSAILILAVTLASILYCINGGIEARGRASEVLFYFVLIPIIIIIATLIPKISITNMNIDFNSTLTDYIKDYLFLTFFFCPAELIVLAKNNFYNNKTVRKNVYGSIALSGIVIICIFISALGIYGTKTLENMEYPVLKLMQISGIPGDFLNRQDGIMCTFLIVSLFGSAWALIYHINEILKFTFLKNKSLKSTLTFTSVLVIIAICSYGILTGNKDDGRLFSATVNVGGTELEEKDFVMSVYISKGKEDLNFLFELANVSGESSDPSSTGAAGSIYKKSTGNSMEDAEKKLSYGNGKEIDYSHMKVILINTEIMEEKELFKNIIAEISGNLDFAENIMVCAVETDKDFSTKNESGNTIEEITKRHESFREAEIFRVNKIFASHEGFLTIPLVDENLKLLGLGIISDKDVFLQYQDSD